MNLDDFTDPAETRRLLEALGAGGEIATAADCSLLSPRTLPAITQLVAHGCLVFAERTTTVTDIWRLTGAGVALCAAAGIDAVLPSPLARKESPWSAPQAPEPPREDTQEVHDAAVHTLVERFVTVASLYLAGGEPDRMKVPQILNALAITTASMIAATAGDDRDHLRDYFLSGLDGQIAVIDGVPP